MDNKKWLAQAFAVFAFFSLSSGNIYAVSITTVPSSSSSTYFLPFGAPDTQSYGQTFIAPSADTILNNFSLYLADVSGNSHTGTGTLNFYGYIAEWSGTAPGAILYKSGIQTMTANGTMHEYIFDTNSSSLTGGGTYLAYLSIAELPTQNANQFSMPYVSDRITGGFTFKNSYDPSWSLVHQGSLNSGSSDGDDVWFKANFSDTASAPVPEPGTMVLLGSGLAGLVGYGRRRFKK